MSIREVCELSCELYDKWGIQLRWPKDPIAKDTDGNHRIESVLIFQFGDPPMNIESESWPLQTENPVETNIIRASAGRRHLVTTGNVSRIPETDDETSQSWMSPTNEINLAGMLMIPCELAGNNNRLFANWKTMQDWLAPPSTIALSGRDRSNPAMRVNEDDLHQKFLLSPIHLVVPYMPSAFDDLPHTWFSLVDPRTPNESKQVVVPWVGPVDAPSTFDWESNHSLPRQHQEGTFASLKKIAPVRESLVFKWESEVKKPVYDPDELKFARMFPANTSNLAEDSNGGVCPPHPELLFTFRRPHSRMSAARIASMGRCGFPITSDCAYNQILWNRSAKAFYVDNYGFVPKSDEPFSESELAQIETEMKKFQEGPYIGKHESRLVMSRGRIVEKRKAKQLVWLKKGSIISVGWHPRSKQWEKMEFVKREIRRDYESCSNSSDWSDCDDFNSDYSFWMNERSRSSDHPIPGDTGNYSRAGSDFVDEENLGGEDQEASDHSFQERFDTDPFKRYRKKMKEENPTATASSASAALVSGTVPSASAEVNPASSSSSAEESRED
jgi:hypothetical protein